MHKKLATHWLCLKTSINLKQAEGDFDIMAATTIPHYTNDIGAPKISIGVKEFMCCGASEPHDHPHVFLDMGEDNQIVCPYCSTLFSYEPGLGASNTNPAGCLLENA